MFRAELTCISCEFATDPFIIGYHPPSDTIDLTFQNLSDCTFRVVTCDGIMARTGSDSPTEQELDAVVHNLEVQCRRDDEELLNLWISPEEFARRRCPKCRDRTVALRLLSIL